MAAGHDTYLHRAGSGSPVVLLHGSGAGVSAWANWSGVFADFAQRFDVIAPDIAGFGDTPMRPDTAYDITVWVLHLIGILDALGLEKVSCVGNSFGGALSLMTALNHPDRVDRIVCLGTPCGRFPMTDGLRAQMEIDGTRASVERAMSFFPHDPDILTEDMIARRHAAAARPGAIDAFRRLMPPPTDPQAEVRGIPEKLLRKILHPILILHGREDRVVPFERGVDLHRWTPNSDLHGFGACGHWVQIERCADFLHLSHRFLAGEAGPTDTRGGTT
jgi:2-hydroxy-6-oxo-octa-2,4-dienoate hydrolase